MSLNFFKSKPEKTDASLSYNNVLQSLNETTLSAPLNIDKFIQSENIKFSRNQDFYTENDNDNIIKDSPRKIDNNQTYTVQDTRLFVNSLLELSKTMPDLKVKTIESNHQLESSIAQNKQTIIAIQSTQESL